MGSPARRYSSRAAACHHNRHTYEKGRKQQWFLIHDRNMENRTMSMWHYTVDGRNPAPPFGSIKPVVNKGIFTYIYHINWCRISEPSTVSTVPTYDLEKPTTTLSPLRGKIQIQATHLSAKTEVQVSFDILFVRQWYKQKNIQQNGSSFSVEIPWTLTWVFSKKRVRVPSSWWSVEHMLLQEELPNKSTPHDTQPFSTSWCPLRSHQWRADGTWASLDRWPHTWHLAWLAWRDGALEDMGVSKNRGKTPKMDGL